MAFADYVRNWGTLYNAATVAFSKDVQKASQGGSEAGNAVLKALEPAKTKTGPIVASLDRMGKIRDMTGMDEKTLKATLATIAKELKTLGDESKKYVALLDKSIGAEVVLGLGKKAKLKDQAPDSYRQLKILKTELLAINARIANEAKGFAVAKETKKIGDKQAAGMKKARDASDKERKRGDENKANQLENKAKEIEAAARLKKMLLTLASQYNSAMSKGAAAIQKIKAKPTVAVYNEQMNNGGRDIRQQILNIGNMKNNAATKDDKLVKSLPAPGNLVAEIERFATDTGGYRRLPDTATENDVKQAITRFSALHKQIATTYAKLGTMK